MTRVTSVMQRSAVAVTILCSLTAEHCIAQHPVYIYVCIYLKHLKSNVVFVFFTLLYFFYLFLFNTFSISKCDERSCFLYVVNNAEDFQIYFCTELHCKTYVYTFANSFFSHISFILPYNAIDRALYKCLIYS